MKEAKPDAWMPLFIGDWTADTQHLSCEQDGAYFRLVRHYWRKGPLPDDDAVLATLTGLEARAWRKMRPVIAAFFQVGDGLWRHKRVDAELEKWSARKIKAVTRAQAAAAARWERGEDDPPPGNARRNARRSPSSSAPGNAPSIGQAVLEECPSSSSRKVEGLKQPSTLPGRPAFAARADGAATPSVWAGPKELRAAVVSKMGEDWTASWLDPCEWDEEASALLAPRDLTVTHLEQNVRRQLVAAQVSEVRVRGRAA